MSKSSICLLVGVGFWVFGGDLVWVLFGFWVVWGGVGFLGVVFVVVFFFFF